MIEMKRLALDTPIGKLQLIGDYDRLVKILLPNSEYILTNNVQLDICSSNDPCFKETKDFIERYFRGEPVSWQGNPIPDYGDFYSKVWKELVKVPFGKTISYGELAARAGSPRAARAVGSAMANNPIPILVPCHRVITSDGKLGGFGGGLDMKRWLLRHEGIEI
jgi:methylated-DNA-[protein]-cysteine S-methyltransferase